MKSAILLLGIAVMGFTFAAQANPLDKLNCVLSQNGSQAKITERITVGMGMEELILKTSSLKAEVMPINEKDAIVSISDLQSKAAMQTIIQMTSYNSVIFSTASGDQVNLTCALK